MSALLEHAGSGVRLVVPDGWEPAADGSTGAALALEPERPGRGFRASLVLTVESTPLSFRDWQVAADQVLPQLLADYLVLDLERLPVAGLPGGRRLARHVTAEGADVTMEQWAVLAGGLGITLTGSVETLRYDQTADVFTAAASTLVVPA
ncbi:hypothetical protein CLV35_1906 [Motilibacter peucedani]|uniref:Uncharacterized protein n=1 Tax=Motilibacter peucedani TaxID=598650 RepID=A0A420XQ99_9ACTN|nr:hypothetical protein [Motilibacter peucedani]RKS75440.1 hypothetical protein CLV35_1906 [Motilibacter peucedani]